MLLHEQLKQELLMTINKIAESTKLLDTKTALLFGELRELILHTPTATMLTTHIQFRLKKVPYRLLGFLPLVIDVRRAIESVLNNSKYKLVSLLVEEHAYIRDENIQLRQQIKALLNSTRYADLEQHFINLEKRMNEKKEENSLLKKENVELCKVVTNQEIEISDLERMLQFEQARNARLEGALRQEKAKNAKANKSSEPFQEELSELRYGEKFEEEPHHQRRRWTFSFKK